LNAETIPFMYEVSTLHFSLVAEDKDFCQCPLRELLCDDIEFCFDALEWHYLTQVIIVSE